MFDTAIILAGGRGARMFPVSDYVPKPLVKVHGIPLIDHCIDIIRKCGISSIYVTYGYKSELLVPHIEKRVDGFINTIGQNNTYFLNHTIIKHIDRPIVIMPCDIIMDIAMETIYNECISRGSIGSYILPVKYKKGMNPDFIRHDASLKITEIGRSFKTDCCASGLQVITPRQINDLITSADGEWNDIWKKLIDGKSLGVLSAYVKKWETYDTLDQILETNATS
jgi:NDP-sugar pyrophosphorylase family protein